MSDDSIPPESAFRRWANRFVQLILVTFIAISMTAVLAWSIGRILSDRWTWSQWLLWIPTLSLLPAAVLGGAAAWRLAPRLRRRRIVLGWLALLAVITVYVFGFEHHMFRMKPDRSGDASNTIRLLHWNAGGTNAYENHPSWTPIIEVNADISIITHPWGLSSRPPIKKWMGDDGIIRVQQRFAVFSRIPLIEQRPLIAVDQIVVVLFVFDTTSTLGKPLTVYAIDLPSNPRQSRIELARRVRRLLDEDNAPAPDLVVGDFNMTRGSLAMRTMFPTLNDVYNTVGRGFAGTYPRTWPLYHIDHSLHRPELGVIDHVILDPGLGRHRMQLTELGTSLN